MTWYESVGYCATFGARLVEINDELKNTLIQVHMEDVEYTTGFWMGASDKVQVNISIISFFLGFF